MLSTPVARLYKQMGLSDTHHDHGHGQFTGKPVGLYWRSHTLFILSTVVIGLFSETFLYGIAVPILPFLLEDRIGIRHDNVQSYSSLLLATYSISSIIFCPIAGVVADKSASRRLPFMFALVLLIIVTPIFFATSSMTILIITRCVQGAGCAFVWTVGFALCLDSVGSENMGKTLGTVLSIVGIGSLLSPPLGGILYSRSGVLAVALLATSVLLVDLIMRSLLIEKKVASHYQSEHVNDIEPDDVPSSSKALELQMEPSEGETGSEHDSEDDLPLTEEEIGLINKKEPSASFIVGRPSTRLLRVMPLLTCFHNPSFLVALFLNATQALLLGAFDATLPLEANDLYHFGSITSGLLFIPLAISRLIFGPVGGWAVDRFGSKLVAVVGYTSLIPILISFRFVTYTSQTISIIIYCLLLTLCGVCLAVVATPGFVEAGTVVQKYHDHNPNMFGASGPFASLYGLNLMAFSIGMALGPIMAGSLKDRFGYGNMNSALALLCGSAAILSFFWLGEEFDESEKKRTVS